MEPVAISVKFGFGEFVGERNGVFFAEGAGFDPGVALEGEAFDRSGVGSVF